MYTVLQMMELKLMLLLPKILSHRKLLSRKLPLRSNKLLLKCEFLAQELKLFENILLIQYFVSFTINQFVHSFSDSSCWWMDPFTNTFFFHQFNSYQCVFSRHHSIFRFGSRRPNRNWWFGRSSNLYLIRIIW